MGSIRLHGALVSALVLVAVACGGGSPAVANDPAGSVQAAMTAVSSGGLAKMVEFSCAAKKADLTSAFGGGNLGALEAAGIKADDIFNAMSISFSNVTTKEVSKTDTAATVHVTADMKTSVDATKFKAILKTMMAAQGQPVDDATIDAAMTAMSTSLSQTTKLDEDLSVVNEGGKWLICE
ncbi:MAG TPA: hypothetical protein VFY18_11115 [Candidatus Limnocylindrales bacterium]|nr:hypothetical protein [Candidatus Limnocylindrales bacterium]